MIRLRLFWPALVSLLAPLLPAAPTHLVEEPPVTVQRLADGSYLLDFGRVAFGNLRLEPPAGTNGAVTVHFGEAMAAGRILRRPPGSVRYGRAVVSLPATSPVIAAPAADARNTRQVQPGEKPDQYGQIAPSAVLTPPEWGVVLPFRWVEIEGWPGEMKASQVRRRAAYAATWDDTAAQFRSADPTLDRSSELCR